MEVGRSVFFPYVVGRIEIAGGRRPYVFHILLRGDEKCVPRAIEKIAGVFAKNRIPILQFHTSGPCGNQRIVVFVDMDGREDIVEEIKNRVSEAVGGSVDVSGPLFDGVALDVWSHPLVIGVHRGIMWTEHMYRGLIRTGWERLGDAFGAFLYSMGTDAGREFYVGVSRLAPRVHQPGLAFEILRLLGLGVFKWVLLLKNRAVVDVYDSFECSIYRGERAEQPMGLFVKGLLRGWLSGYWGIEPNKIEGWETRCIALGDKLCRFEFSH